MYVSLELEVMGSKKIEPTSSTSQLTLSPVRILLAQGFAFSASSHERTLPQNSYLAWAGRIRGVAEIWCLELFPNDRRRGLRYEPLVSDSLKGLTWDSSGSLLSPRTSWDATSNQF